VNKHRPTIVLVGLMGVGKSTVAWELAHTLGVPCLDTDKLIEQRVGKSVRDIFAEDGEQYFRERETDVLGECLHSPDGAVIAAAGGVVVSERNRQLLEEASRQSEALVVWLTAPPEVLAERTSKGVHRPLLDGDRLGVLQKLTVERESLYKEVADMVIDVTERSPESVVSLIVSAVEVSYDE